MTSICYTLLSKLKVLFYMIDYSIWYLLVNRHYCRKHPYSLIRKNNQVDNFFAINIIKFASVYSVRYEIAPHIFRIQILFKKDIIITAGLIFAVKFQYCYT